MNCDFDRGPNSLALTVTLQYTQATPERADDWLRAIRRVIDQGRQVLRRLRLADPGSTGFERALADLADGATKVRILVLGHARKLPPAVEEDVSLIAREALSNALRHAEATSIEVELEYLTGRLRLVVRDDGIGIDREALERRRGFHWGLTKMRERAASVGAELRLLSRAGAGTEVELSVPSELAYLYARGGSPANFETSAVA